MESPRQVGALPIRRRKGRALEVLLVTTRETRRWVIPKGWPSKRLSDRKAALREAHEEAGITGDIAKTSLGQYKYFKRYADGFQLVTVDVYLLAVERELEVWPEQQDRTRAWLPVEEAAAAVIEPGLREIILALKGAGKPVKKGRIGKTLRARASRRGGEVAMAAKGDKAAKGKKGDKNNKGAKSKRQGKTESGGEADLEPAAKRLRLKKRMLEKVRKAWA